jgi:hypothetical protein
LTASLHKYRVVPTVDCDSLVPLGLYTHDMSDEEFSNLLELAKAFAAQKNVKLSAPRWLEKMAGEQRSAK